jgi:hypothetical protein
MLYRALRLGVSIMHDEGWKATFLVALGTRAANEEHIAKILCENMERQPELRTIMDGILENYWPTFSRLASDAKNSFRLATRLLFDTGIGEAAWVHAGIAAGKSSKSNCAPRCSYHLQTTRTARSSRQSAPPRLTPGLEAGPEFLLHHGFRVGVYPELVRLLPAIKPYSLFTGDSR